MEDENNGILRVAMYQGGILAGLNPLEENENVKIFDSVLSSLAAKADIVVFPELFISGYNAKETRFCALDRRDFENFFKKIIAEHGVYVCIAYAELCCEEGVEKIYNSVALFDRVGKTLIHHRKTQLWDEFEKKNFFPGMSLPPVISIGRFLVSVLICYEVEFCEIVRVMGKKGCNLLLCPTAVCGPSIDFITQKLIPTRALENNLFLFYCNRVGVENDMEFPGKSICASPTGEILLQMDGGSRTEIVSCDFAEVQKSRKTFPYLTDLNNNCL